MLNACIQQLQPVGATGFAPTETYWLLKHSTQLQKYPISNSILLPHSTSSVSTTYSMNVRPKNPIATLRVIDLYVPPVYSWIVRLLSVNTITKFYWSISQKPWTLDTVYPTKPGDCQGENSYLSPNILLSFFFPNYFWLSIEIILIY